MSVRAKFRVGSIEDWGQSRILNLSAVYESGPDATPENARFTKATPNGTLKMTVDNPGAYEQFEIGDEWYLDFTKGHKAGPGLISRKAVDAMRHRF